MNRIDWLVEKFGKTLLTTAFFIHGEMYATPREAIDQILRADPSHNKKFAQWLVQAYIRGDYRHEDCEKTFETLSLFQVHSQKLEQKFRDINQHSSVAAIWKLLKIFVENPEETQSGKEKRRADRQRARSESLILVEEPDVIVAVPLTKFAAIWWGRGTRWCTSMESPNHFGNYRKAPLFVILCHGLKVQAYVHKQKVQIVDDNDGALGDSELTILKENLPELMEWFARATLKANLMPAERIDMEFVREAVRANGASIINFPPHLLSKDIYREAVENCPWAIASVPESIIDSEMCSAAIRGDGLCFPYLPLEFQTRETLLLALEEWGFILDLIPEDERTREHCETAIRTGVVNLESIPGKFWDEELAAMILRRVNDSLEYMQKRRPDLLSNAVDSIGRVQATVNDCPLWARPHVITLDLCVIAVRNDKDAWQHVPREMQTEEVVQAQISRAGRNSFTNAWERRSGHGLHEAPAQLVAPEAPVTWNECPERVEAVKAIFANRGVKTTS